MNRKLFWLNENIFWYMLLKCFKIQRNNYFNVTNYSYIQWNNYLYTQRNSYFYSTNYLFIQRIIYIFNEWIIFIQQIKYIYSTNELKNFYSSKSNIWSTKYKLEDWNLVFILHGFTQGTGLTCTWFRLNVGNF